MWPKRRSLWWHVAALLGLANAISLNVTDDASVKNAASTIALDLMSYYTATQPGSKDPIGFFPTYWWEAGAVWGALIDYWHYTGDASYNHDVGQALVSQLSPTNDFMPTNVQSQEGNDDQAFWAFAALSAVEKRFPATSLPSGVSWLQVAENVFNSQVARWNNTACGGGLKWQIFPANPGYNYKNSVSNGAFFHLAARLARYTGNQTYVDWASKAWDWMEAVGFIDAQFNVFDGAETATNCTNIDQVKWTYNNGLLLYGSAVLSNYTNGSSLWTDRSTSMLQAALQFFTPFPNATYILYEPACESVGTCDADQYSFKGFLARWMGPTMQMMASTTDAVMTLLKASAAGAAQSCSGGELQTTCGERWYIDGFDNSAGVGQELSALEVVQALLVRSAPAPIVSSVVHIQIEVSSTMSATKTTASTMATVPSFTTHLAPASSSSAATTSADGAFGLLASILRGLVYSTAVAFAGRAFV